MSRVPRRFVVALAALVALAAGCSRPARERAAAVESPAAAANEPSLLELKFAFVDADGRTRTLEEFRGRPFIASMIYTNCKSVCPRVTADLQNLERALSPELRERTRFVLFSLDPGRDTPAALAAFAEQHHLDRARWTLLASSEDDMRTLAAVLGMRFRPDGGGEIAHSALIVVADADGVVRHRQAGVTDQVDSLAAAVRAVAQE